MMFRIHTATLAAGAVAGLMMLSACGGLGYGNRAAPANQPQSGTQNQESSQTGGVTLAVAQVGNLGQVVTDQNGLTLYRFDKDKAKPSASNCIDACAQKWPPALGDPASVQLQGVDQALVGSVTRADGTQQLTLGGWPLYTFANDTAAGEAKGQGVGKTWYAVTPQGKKAQAASSKVQGGTGSSGSYSGSNSGSSSGSYGSGSSGNGSYGSGGY
jgi:predicted lipoprotein with Yx(FWY)xxD motif